jgi:SnoaL-like domain
LLSTERGSTADSGGHKTPTAVVQEAIERFNQGDVDGFADSFTPDAVVWADPQLAAVCVLTGRSQIVSWCNEARLRWSELTFSHGELFDHGLGAFVELDVVSATNGGAGAWRLPIAVFVREGKVSEVLPQSDRDTAMAALSVR